MNERHDQMPGPEEEKEQGYRGPHGSQPSPVTQHIPEEDVGDPELQIYLRILLQRRWLILFCVVIFLAVGVLQLRRATPVYSSTATIKFEPTSPRIVDFADIEQAGHREEIQTQMEMIRSPKIALAVIDALNLNMRTIKPVSEKEEETKRKTSPLKETTRWISEVAAYLRNQLVTFKPVKIEERVIEEQRRVASLLSNVRVSRKLDTNLINITVLHRNPLMAARIADEFCDQYIRSKNEERLAAYKYAQEYLQDQIEQTKAVLDEKEKELYDFMRAQAAEAKAANPEDPEGTLDIRILEQNYEIAVRTMKTLGEDIEQTRNELALLEADKAALKSEIVRDTLLVNDEDYRSLLNQMMAIEIQLASLKRELKPTHPDVKALVTKKEVIQEQINKLKEEKVGEILGRSELAKLRLDALRSRLNEQEALVEEIQRERNSYRRLEREVEAIKQIYDSLIDRSKELDVTGDLVPVNVVVVARGFIPNMPTEPKITSTLTKFGIMGLLTGVGLVFFFFWLDRSVKYPTMVEQKLGLPTLGLVPYLSGKRMSRLLRSSRNRMAATKDVDSKLLEPFHYIRTSLMYSCSGAPPQVMLVTSCYPSEGKTTIAINLAMSFAERGDKVIILDADFKRPYVHKSFELSKIPGATDVLTGQLRLEECVVPSGIENLNILPAGPSTPSPVNLLESKNMQDLIQILRDEYDVVIVDSAPAHGMPDSLVLSNYVDGVVLVVNRGETLTEVLVKTANSLTRMGAQILGIVYNNTKRHILEEHSYYGYGYGYWYGYGYGYGYRQKKEDEVQERKDLEKRKSREIEQETAGTSSDTEKD